MLNAAVFLLLQAQEVLRGSGSLTPERKQYLEELRNQLSVSQDKADKIIREVRCPVKVDAGRRTTCCGWDRQRTCSLPCLLLTGATSAMTAICICNVLLFDVTSRGLTY
jgi:hypothetical protein